MGDFMMVDQNNLNSLYYLDKLSKQGDSIHPT